MTGLPSDNPYQPPQATGDRAFASAAKLTQAERDRLRAIALGQKWVLACVPVSLGMRVVMALAWQAEPLAGPSLAISCVALGLALVTAGCIGWLASRLRGTTWGILAGLVALVPGLTLLPLLIVVFQATSALARAGIPVGLLGAAFHRS